MIFGTGKIAGSRIENSVIYLKGIPEDQNIADRIDVCLTPISDRTRIHADAADQRG